MKAINLNYEKYGSGQPIIILHGLFGSCVNWKTVSEMLSSQFSVYTLDLRNHGESPHSEQFNYNVMTEDLKQFILRHNLQKVIVIGHSLGGKTAMTFASTYPQMVDKLIIVDIAPRAYLSSLKGLIESMMSVKLSQYNKLREIVSALEFQIPDLSTRYFLVKNIKRDKKGQLKWKINLQSIHDNYDNLNKAVPIGLSIDRPTLFIRGEDSDYVMEQDMNVIKTFYFPHAHIVTIPKAGHWVHIDAPNEFVSIVQEFVSYNHFTKETVKNTLD